MICATIWKTFSYSIGRKQEVCKHSPSEGDEFHIMEKREGAFLKKRLDMYACPLGLLIAFSCKPNYFLDILNHLKEYKASRDCRIHGEEKPHAPPFLPCHFLFPFPVLYRCFSLCSYFSPLPFQAVYLLLILRLLLSLTMPTMILVVLRDLSCTFVWGGWIICDFFFLYGFSAHLGTDPSLQNCSEL